MELPRKVLACTLCLLFLHTPDSLSFEPLYEPDVPDTFHIQIDKGKANKYIERFYGAGLSAPVIKEKYKKWSKASIKVDGDSNDKFLKSKIRITGDDPKHVDVSNFKASLKVKLSKGNIANITRFRLLLAETQGGGDEIFWSLLMETIGFPTPYKKIVTVNFLGQEYPAVFEESIEKEFIERWGFRESPIISYDERQLMENIQFSSIERPEYYGPSVLNKAFLKNNIAAQIAYRGMFSNNYFRLKEFYKINGQYAKHGITINNRRFIFDPTYNYKIPIYFDGNVTISIEESGFAERKDIDCELVDKLWISVDEEINKTFENFEYNFSKRAKESINPVQECIAKKIITSTSEWDDSTVQTVYPRKGNKNDTFDFQRKFTGTGKSLDIWNIENYIGANPELFRYKNNGTFEACTIIDEKNKTLDCTIKSFAESLNYLAGESEPYFFNKVRVFPLIVASSIEDQIQINDSLFLDNSETQKITVPSDTTLRITITEKVQEIKLFLDDPQTSRVIFHGSIGQRFKVDIVASKQEKTNASNLIRYDKNLLTSCITFIDTVFDGGEISMTGGDCEDSLNFIRSKGSINLISIKDAAFDAIDLDFSRLYIKHLNILNANNDCIDISAGEYNFNIINASYCGDKIISIGEKSRVTINTGTLNYGNIGIAVKDSSVAYLDNVKITDTNDHCLSAYRKKQEFNGGDLYGREVICDDLSNIFTDAESSISLNELDTCLYLGSFHSIDYCIFRHFISFESIDCEKLSRSNITLSIFIKEGTYEDGANKNNILINAKDVTQDNNKCNININLPVTQDKIEKIIINDGNKMKENLSTQLNIEPEYYL